MTPHDERLVGLALYAWPARAVDVLALPGLDPLTHELAECCAELPHLACNFGLLAVAYAVASPPAVLRAVELKLLSDARRKPLPSWALIVGRLTRPRAAA